MNLSGALKQRDTRLDALRASVLSVVVIMNMMTLSGLAYLGPEMRAQTLGAADRAAWAFLDVFLDGKALAAFSFMFGLSFSMILQRAGPAGETVTTRFLRRFAVLGLIGAFNAIFLFWADILMTYALLGLLLPFAARLPLRMTIALGLGLVLIGPLALALSGVGPPVPVPEGQLESIQAYASSNYADTVSQNLSMVTGATDAATGTLLLRLFTLTGLFLLGLAIGKSGLPGKIAENRALLVRWGALVFVSGLCAGLTLHMIGIPQGALYFLYLETPLMALGYLMLLASALYGRETWLHKLLAPLGRMSLTGYLGASLLGQLAFYGWGFQLIGQLGTLGVIALALATVLLLAGFAQLWFRHFCYGPWEWLWRSLTDLQPQPFRRDSRAPV